MYIEKNLDAIAAAEITLEKENRGFMEFIRSYDNQKELDNTVQLLNSEIAPNISCVECGNCCRTLMVNITELECENISTHLNTTIESFKDKHVETSSEGTYMVMNSMPCTFLSVNSCTIYEHRFNECREFPQLHNDDFKSRTFSTMMHFGRCPIIFNVIQNLKERLFFFK